MSNRQYAKLPAIDKLLSSSDCTELIASYGRAPVLDSLRATLEEIRETLAESNAILAPNSDEIVRLAAADLAQWAAPSPRRVYNLTGTVLHTNLGRALMPRIAIEAMSTALSNAVDLEFDIETGKRGDRDKHVSELLCRLTGAEAATVVNNNAAAVMVILNSLALRKEVPVSRGELIEIGGAFRIPQIMSRAGSKLREVGTTNRTHLSDYSEAITAKTALLMKIHTSNYRIEGFTKAVSERELAKLAHNHDLPLVTDLGSGSIIDLSQYGLPPEPSPRQMLKDGADLVTFSGDKILGGPQAGLIVGRADLIAKIKRNPMTRALRVDKGRLAALRAVLCLAADSDRAAIEIPTLAQLTRPLAKISKDVDSLLPYFSAFAGKEFSAQAKAVESRVGSGSLPGEGIPSMAVALAPLGSKRRAGSALKTLAGELRNLATPIIGRISEGNLLLDMRTLEDSAQLIKLLRDNQHTERP